jgi:hypothetical protein
MTAFAILLTTVALLVAGGIIYLMRRDLAQFDGEDD